MVHISLLFLTVLSQKYPTDPVLFYLQGWYPSPGLEVVALFFRLVMFSATQVCLDLQGCMIAFAQRTAYTDILYIVWIFGKSRSKMLMKVAFVNACGEIVPTCAY